MVNRQWLHWVSAAVTCVTVTSVVHTPRAGDTRLLRYTASNATNWRPVVLMHGLFATSEAMTHAQAWIEQDFPGIYVHNAIIAGDSKDGSLLVDINKQVDELAKVIKSDPKLAKGFNMIGHSQGGLLTRAYIERFNEPPVYNWISWAGPHDGVYGVPDFNALCPDRDCPWLIELMDELMDSGTPAKDIQHFITFAAYWKSPLHYDAYLTNNTFLADINNERPQKNSLYKTRITSLNAVALVTAEFDLIVVPRTSARFEFFKNGSDKVIVPWDQTKAFVEDWLGFRTLHESNRLFQWTSPCGHQDLPREKCKNTSYIGRVQDLLNNTIDYGLDSYSVE